MPWHTDLQVVFDVLDGREREFDWLITDLDINLIPPEFDGPQRAWFFTGEDLSRLVRRQDPPVQFIWAVLTGFERGCSLNLDELEVEPFADGNRGFWYEEPRIQYPGASVELVCWDSTSTLLMTADDDLTSRFRAGFAQAVDLATFNRRRNDGD